MGRGSHGLIHVQRSAQVCMASLWMNYESKLGLLTPKSMCFPSCQMASIGCDLKRILPLDTFFRR